MPGKYRITKTVTTETQSLRTRIEINEADDGSFFGHTSLLDERGDLVERQQLAPEDLAFIVERLTATKAKVIEDVGAVFVPEGSELVEDAAPKKKAKSK